jgi:hypothetical protein
MTAREKFINLLRKLLQATKMKRIVWSDTADENTFRLSFKNGMIHIGEVPNPVFPSKLLTATLFNQNNTPIETIQFDADGPSEEGNLLRELYALARESALRPDDVLESVEAELDQRMSGVAVR